MISDLVSPSGFSRSNVRTRCCKAFRGDLARVSMISALTFGDAFRTVVVFGRMPFFTAAGKKLERASPIPQK
jgi:hypothetical protein